MRFTGGRCRRTTYLSVYGVDSTCRIADPSNGSPDGSRTFTWLLCEVRDDKGNAVLFRYKAEDGTGVDVLQSHERNRGRPDDSRRSANRYIKRIHYGNRTPLLDASGARPRFLDASVIDAQIADGDWMFEVVFDYGEHDPLNPAPRDDEERDSTGAPLHPWRFRIDPFSTYRPGFEVRTTRTCQRVLMFHTFPGTEADGVGIDCLVRSTDFNYSDEVDPTDVANPIYTFLLRANQTGYRRNGTGYDRLSQPPVAFEYSQPIVQQAVETVDPDSVENLPMGLDGKAYQWVDLHGEGVPGILTEQANAWFYKANQSPIPIVGADGQERVVARFAPVQTVAQKPNVSLAEGAMFADLAGDGVPDVVTFDGPAAGFYEHDDALGWEPFRPFTSTLNRNPRDPNVRYVDLDGDGRADVLITEGDAIVWHPSLGEGGFDVESRLPQSFDEEKGPRLVLADEMQSIYVADLSGDGLSDLVRIRNGEICYWPNLGYGRFGAKVTMDGAPVFDQLDQFNPARIRLADIDGSGTTDIIYLHRDGARLYFNQSGNAWSAPQTVPAFPAIDDLMSVLAVDLLGNGTACLVWSSPWPADSGRPMRYVNLMGSVKPHLLVGVVDNLGGETQIQYAPSTKFYLQDKAAGTPWVTRLPFPVHVVERIDLIDRVSRNRFVSVYTYRHGYFDGEDREFRGFGLVERTDTDAFEDYVVGVESIDGTQTTVPELNQPPVTTRTWFHTGAFLSSDRLVEAFRLEYYGQAQLLPDPILPAESDTRELRDAFAGSRACLSGGRSSASTVRTAPRFPIRSPKTDSRSGICSRVATSDTGSPFRWGASRLR